MKVVIFGADRLGIAFYFEIKAREDVVAFIDNDVKKQGMEILGIKIYSADDLKKIEFDKVYIASKYHYEDIERQIKDLGVHQSKICCLPIQNSKDKERINHLYHFHEIFRKEEYDEAWKKIKEKYKDIIVYGVPGADAIGEFISRFIMISNTCEKNGVLRVFIPEMSSGRICNKYLAELLRRKIYIVQENDAAFWAYVLKEYPEDLDLSSYDKYSSRNTYPVYKMDSNYVNWFTNAEMEEGNMSLNQMGLDTPFVCVAARTAAYNKKTIGHDFSYDYRNMDFEDYKPAIKYLQQKNIVTVRMGRMESSMKAMENCIDYAGLYADDFRDLYLASKCKFMIANSSGIIFMASLFSKPVLIVNSVMISLGYGGTPYTDRDLYIPKKYYDVHKDKYLTLREIMEVESQCIIFGDRYEKMGIKFIDNTPEEITEVTKEMVQRIEGVWQDDAKDQKNYEKYLEIYHDMVVGAANNPNNWLGAPMPQRIATTYLRNNLYLLE